MAPENLITWLLQPYSFATMVSMVALTGLAWQGIISRKLWLRLIYGLLTLEVALAIAAQFQ